MPIYTYYCKNCKKEFMASHGMLDKCDICKRCGSKDIKRVIDYSAPVIFKGEGFTRGRS